MRSPYSIPDRVIGRCYACQGPVHATQAAHVTDAAVSQVEGRPVRRLAHRGACAMELERRIGGRT